MQSLNIIFISFITNIKFNINKKTLIQILLNFYSLIIILIINAISNFFLYLNILILHQNIPKNLFIRKTWRFWCNKTKLLLSDENNDKTNLKKIDKFFFYFFILHFSHSINNSSLYKCYNMYHFPNHICL